jgi:hypothetical protein
MLEAFKPNPTSTHFLEQDMKIENLSQDLDSGTMSEVTGGVALTGQVVPTNLQCNALAQKFDIGSCEPVALGNSADQSNYSTQHTDLPVGSIFVNPSWCAE